MIVMSNLYQSVIKQKSKREEDYGHNYLNKFDAISRVTKAELLHHAEYCLMQFSEFAY
jgi:hypothetical protein